MNDEDLKIYEENARLREQVAELKKARAWISITPSSIGALSVILVGALLTWGLFYSVEQSNKPAPASSGLFDFCYPFAWDVTHVALKAHRVGVTNADIQLSIHGNIADAIAAAKQLDCPMMKPKR